MPGFAELAKYNRKWIFQIQGFEFGIFHSENIFSRIFGESGNFFRHAEQRRSQTYIETDRLFPNGGNYVQMDADGRIPGTGPTKTTHASRMRNEPGLDQG